MMRTLALFLLLLGSSSCFAQQKIVFEKNNGWWTKKYSLPKSVICSFKDGTKQRLVLEKVKGDSLIFQKYYNQQNYDCLYSSLKRMKIHKNGENFLYVLCGGLASCAIWMSYLSYLGYHTEIHDAGEANPRLMATLILFPVAIATTGTIITLASFPKSYKPVKWKLYAK